LVYLNGRAVSGQFLLKHNVFKSNKAKVQDSLNDEIHKPIEQRHALIQKNVYKVPKIFRESKFDKDIEGENFYVMEDSAANSGSSRLDKIMV